MSKFGFPILALFAILGGAFYYIFFMNMQSHTTGQGQSEQNQTQKFSTLSSTSPIKENGNLSKAYFAGGCFWCMEGIFEAQSGVTQAIAGYAGGTSEDATYELVSAGRIQHREAVEITYDPSVISYMTLVDLYFTQIDPTQTDGQFGDRGYRYTTAILYMTDAERQIVKSAIEKLEASHKFDKPIAVKMEPLTTFFMAEEYHQDYYKKSAFRYNLYKEGSGRKGYIDDTWTGEIQKIEASIATSSQDRVGGLNPSFFETQGDISVPKNPKENIREKLTDIQYRVTQEEGTEQPFVNPYWDNHEGGIYVDIVDGSPLFASIDKFDSGTGWPSFTRVMTGASIVEKTDTQLFSTRTEVRSKNADSHLGHLFTDGPADQGGMRYCINSAALRFIPVADLEKEGYEEYKSIFDKQ